MAKKIEWNTLSASQVLSLIPTLPIETVNVSEFGNPDKDLNYREVEQYEARSPDLAVLISEQSQREPITAIDDGKQLHAAQGMLRLHAFLHAKGRKMVFANGPFAGQPMADHVQIRRIGTLRPEVEAEVRADHGGSTGLSKYGVAKQVIDLARKGYKEKDILLRIKGTMDQLYPLSKEQREKVKPITEDGGETYVAARHGRAPLMVWLYVADGPKILEAAYLDKQRGKLTYPNDTEVRTLVKVYRAELADDKTLRYGVNKPGPEFMAKWHAMLAEHAKAEAEQRAPKSTGMLNQEQIKGRVKQAQSRIAKALMAFTLDASTNEKFTLVDEMLAEIEADKKFGPIITKLLDKVLPEDKPATESDAVGPAEAEALAE